jgi:CDP-diacylglycerol pyrophosphatase
LFSGPGLQRAIAGSRPRAAALLAVTLLSGAGATWALGLPEPNNRDALRRIVQQDCLVHWQTQHDPAPCLQITVPAPSQRARGYAVLPDRKGGAHFLLIPTQTLTGIEDPRVLQAGSVNYFAAAWKAREYLAAVVGHALRRESVGLAVNSALQRGQDQLHIHIECLQPRLYDELRSAGEALGNHWSDIRIEDSPYQAMRIMGGDLGKSNPFELLARRLPRAAKAMGAYTLVVAGMQFAAGPGFIVLAGRTAPSRPSSLASDPAWARPGETLLDGSCALER